MGSSTGVSRRMHSRGFAVTALYCCTALAVFVGACTGGEDGGEGAEPVGVEPMERTLAGNPDADVLTYEAELETNLATPQLDSLAGIDWGMVDLMGLIDDLDVQAALQTLSATPQLYGGPDCSNVGARIDAAIDALASAFADAQVDPPACATTADANACVAAGFLVVASAVNEEDRSAGASTILACLDSITPTPTPSPSGSPTGSATASPTASASPTSSATTSPTSSASPTPSGSASPSPSVTASATPSPSPT